MKSDVLLKPIDKYEISCFNIENICDGFFIFLDSAVHAKLYQARNDHDSNL